MRKLIILLGIFLVSISILLTIYLFKNFLDIKINLKNYLKVGVVKVYGTISSHEGILEETVTPEKFRDAFKEAEKDSDIILIVINSPGGSYYASLEIADIIKSSKKTTICYITEMATSGAYLVASSCDKIFSSKAAIIGSIGVIMFIPQYKKLLEKLGVNITIIKGGKYKDMFSGLRNLSEEEYTMLKNIVDYVYDEFVKEVAMNRNLSPSYVKEIAEGKIYIAEEAKKLGLIDDICNFNCIKKYLEKTYGKKVLFKSYNYKRESLLEKLFFKLGYGIGKAFVEYFYKEGVLR